MKNSLILKIRIFVFLLFNVHLTHGQFINGTNGPNFWGETDNNQKIEAIGIGDYTNSGAQPNAALDITIPYLFLNTPNLIYQGEAIRSSAAHDFDHTWKMFTFPETEKFRVENPNNSVDINLSVMQEKGILRLNTTDGLYGLEERMRFTYGLGGPTGNVGTTKAAISYGSGFPAIDQPQAILNLGHRSILGSLGARKWMDVGTFMVDAEDQMYVGIKDDRGTGGADRGTAVINWGDNPTSGYGPDMLKFIFTSGLVTGSASDAEKEDGLEIARMTAYGNMGIGNVWNLTNILPKRRLDIWDNAGSPTSNPAHVNGPQLRLTHTPDATLTGGKWTDLETTGLGDFYIHPFDGTTNRNVGINTNIPGNTLEIKSNAGTANPGSSGLRFTYLNTSSIPLVTNPFGSSSPAVLSVDNQGNVVLVKDETVSPSSGLNVCGSGIPNNYLLRMDVTGTNTVCKSNVYDDYANVKVGIDDATPSYKLDVAGDLGINAPLYYLGNRMLANEGSGGGGAWYGSNLYLGINAGNISTPNSGYLNTALGVEALSTLSASTSFNTAVGGYALKSVTTGYSNSTVGSNSGIRTTTGNNNVFIGYKAAINNQTGSDNVAIGVHTASDQVSGSGDIGDANVIIGYAAGGSLTTNADGNVALGHIAGYYH